MAYTTIKKPSDYFNTKLYTGNGSTQSITGVGFQPDWTIIKGRNATNSHNVYDAVRSAGKTIVTDANYAESTDTARLTSFDSDGFSLGSNNNVNENSINFVSWNWLANGTGVSNTDGSITSTVSANTISGFSIVSYTGTGANATVGHSLGSVAKMIMVKRRDTSGRWQVYHNSLGATKYLFLDGNEEVQTASNRWNDTTPTSSVFSLGSSAEVNASGGTYIAYCFSEVKGFSKFGSYNGNGSTDGTFVYTGFKPAFVIIKRYDASSVRDWFILDNKRDTENPVTKNLYTNNSNAEVDSERGDFLSNGFKLTTSSGGSNAVDGTFIYMAFAEEPLVGDNPATAR